MKIFSKLIISLITALSLSSCSLMERWGVAQPHFDVLEKHHEFFGGREFVTRRLVVDRATGETFVETLEVQSQ
jgi:hypothetical protein